MDGGNGKIVCDLCCAEVVGCWTYTTPSEAATPEEALLHQVYWAEDPEWAVCEDCHQIIQTGTLAALIERSIRKQCEILVVDPDGLPTALLEEIVDKIIEIQSGFWHHIQGEPYYEENANEHTRRNP